MNLSSDKQRQQLPYPAPQPVHVTKTLASALLSSSSNASSTATDVPSAKASINNYNNNNGAVPYGQTSVALRRSLTPRTARTTSETAGDVSSSTRRRTAAKNTPPALSQTASVVRGVTNVPTQRAMPRASPIVYEKSREKRTSTESGSGPSVCVAVEAHTPLGTARSPRTSSRAAGVPTPLLTPMTSDTAPQAKKDSVTSALMELFPTSLDSTSANRSSCSSSDVNTAATTTTTNNTTRNELPPVSRGSASFTSSDAPHRSCRSIPETVVPSSRDGASSNTSVDFSAPPLLFAMHGRSGLAASMATSSISAIPHPPVILTARALARASRGSGAQPGQLKGLPVPSAPNPGEPTANPTLVDADAATAAVADSGGSARPLPQHRMESLTSSSRTLAPSLTPNNVSAASSPMQAQASPLAPSTTTEDAKAKASSEVTSPVSISDTTHAASKAAATAASRGRGSSQGRRRLRCGQSLSSLSSPSISSVLAFSPYASNPNSGTGSNAPRSSRGSRSRRSSEARSEVNTSPAAEHFTAFANADLFQPMLPTTLASGDRSRVSLSTVCSTSAIEPSSPNRKKSQTMPRVLETSVNPREAPPSRSTTAKVSQAKPFSKAKRSATVTAARSAGATTLPANARLLPTVVVKGGPAVSLNGGGRRYKSLPASSGVPSSSSSLSASPPHLLTMQHRPLCYPLLSRIVANAGASTAAPDTPLTPREAVRRQEASRETTSSSSSINTTTTTAPSTPGDPRATLLRPFLAKSSVTGERPSALSPLDVLGAAEAGGLSPLHNIQPPVTALERHSSPPVLSVKPSPAAGGDSPAWLPQAHPAPLPSRGVPSLHLPINALNSLTSSANASVTLRKPSQPCLKKSPRPATTCNVERRSSGQPSSASSLASATHASLNTMAATARRVSTSTPSSPLAAGHDPQMLVPASPQPTVAAVLSTLTSSINKNTADAVDGEASKTETAPADSLNSRSGDRDSGVHTASRLQTPTPSSALLVPQRPPALPALALSEAAVTAAALGKAAESVPHARMGPDTAGPAAAPELVSMLQSSSTFAAPFAFPESASMVDDASLYFGTSINTQRFVSTSRIFVPRTPLSQAMSNARGGSVDSAFGASTRVVAASSQAPGRASTGTASGRGGSGEGATQGARSRPVERDASAVSLSMDDIIMAVLEGRSSDNFAASTPPPPRSLRRARPSGASPRTSDGQPGLGHRELNSATRPQSSAESAGSGTADAERQLSPHPPPAPRVGSSVSSSFQRDDAAVPSISSGNGVHAYPSIATFASDESQSSHSREKSESRGQPSPLQDSRRSGAHHMGQDHPPPDTSAEAAGSRSKDGRGASSGGTDESEHTNPFATAQLPRPSDSNRLQLTSTTLRSNTVSAKDDSNLLYASAIETAAAAAAKSKGASEVSLSTLQTPLVGEEHSVKQEGHRRRSSTMKMLSQSAVQLAERIRHSKQWSRRRGSQMSVSGVHGAPPTPSRGVASNCQSSGQGVPKVTSGDNSISLPGTSGIGASTTVAFADLPTPALPSSTVRRDRLSTPPHASRQDKEDGPGGEGSNGGSPPQTAASILSSAAGGESCHAFKATPRSRKHSVASAVSKLWSKVSTLTSRRSSVGTIGSSTTAASSIGGAGSRAGSMHSVGEAAPQLPHLSPAHLSSTTATEGEDADGRAVRTTPGAATPFVLSENDTETSTQSGSPKMVFDTVTPRLSKAPVARTDDDNEYMQARSKTTALDFIQKGKEDAAFPKPLHTSFEDDGAGFVGASTSGAVAHSFRSPFRRGSLAQATRSARSSADTVVPGDEGQHVCQRNSNTTCGSIDPWLSRDSTQAPISWHAVESRPSTGDVQVLRFDEASPLAPNSTPSRSVSVLSGSSSSASLEASEPQRESRSQQSELSVTTVTKPHPAKARSHHAVKAEEPLASAPASLRWAPTQGQSSAGTAATPHAPVPQEQLPSPSFQVRHGLYEALKAGSESTADHTQLYAGQGQATYDHFSSTNAKKADRGDGARSTTVTAIQQMPSMSNPFAVAAAIRSRPGSGRPGSGRPGSARSNLSRPGSARPGSAGFRRQRLADSQHPATITTPATTSAFHSVMCSPSGTFSKDGSSSPSTPMSEVQLPPNTVALPRAGQQPRSARSRGLNIGILSTWIKAAQAWLEPAEQLISLRVPATTSPSSAAFYTGSGGNSGGGVADHHTSATAVSFAQNVALHLADPPRRRVFTSALQLSMTGDPPLAQTGSGTFHTGAAVAPASKPASFSPDSTSSGSAQRWSAAQTATAIGFTPIDTQLPISVASDARSRWSLTSTSKRKWTSSLASSHGSGHPQHNGGLVLRAPSVSSSAFTPLKGSSPVSPQGIRRGFSGRKFTAGGTNSNGGGGANNTAAAAGGVGSSMASGRRSPRKLKSGIQQRQTSPSHAKQLAALPRATSAESRRTGQVVLMDALPLSPEEKQPRQQQQQQQRHASLVPVSKSASQARSHRVSLVSGGSGSDGVSIHVVPQRTSFDGQPLPHAQAARKLSEGWQQSVPLERPSNTERSAVQGHAGSRRSTGTEERWLAAVLPPEADRAPQQEAWLTSGLSPGFTPPTMSLVDVSILLSGEVDHAEMASSAAGSAAATADSQARRAYAAGEAAAAFTTPTSDSDSLQHAAHSPQQDESSTKSILSNANNSHQHHLHHSRVSKRSSSTAGALISPVSLSIFMNSVSFGSTNVLGGGSGTSAPPTGTGGATVGGSAAPSVGVAQLANASLSNTMGSGPMRSRSNRSYSPPPALLSCEAAPALFGMGSGFAALHLQDSPSLGVGRGTVPHFSLDRSAEEQTLTASPLQRGSGGGIQLDTTSPRPPPTTTPVGGGAAASPLLRATPSPVGNAQERRDSVALASAAPGAGAAAPLVSSTSSRHSSRYTRTPSVTGSNAPIPAPPSTTLTTTGSAVRNRRVGSMLTAHGSSAVGSLGLLEPNNPTLRNPVFTAYSRHSSVASDMASDRNTSSGYMGTGNNSPLASSILYVPPELRRGPEWRHLQQYIAHNVAESHQRDAGGFPSHGAVDSFGLPRGHSLVSNEGPPSGEAGKDGCRRPTTTSLTSSSAPFHSHPAAAPPSSAASPSQAAAMHREDNYAVHRPSINQQFAKMDSLPSADTLGDVYSLVTPSATVQTVPQPPLPQSLLTAAEMPSRAIKNDVDGGAHADGNEGEERSSARTPRGSKTGPSTSTAHKDNASAGATMDAARQSPIGPTSGRASANAEGALTESQHRLSDDRRTAHERSATEDTSSSVRGSARSLRATSSSRHPSSSQQQSWRHNRILSGVPFVASESDDEEGSRDGRSSSSSSRRAFSTSGASRTGTPAARAEVARRGAEPGNNEVANLTYSLSFSFPSARFAFTTPGMGERKMVAISALARFSDSGTSAEEPAAYGMSSTKAAVARRASRGSNVGLTSAGGSYSSGSGRKASALLDKKESSFHSAPDCRYERKTGGGETAVQKVVRLRNTILASAERRDSRSISGSAVGKQERQRSMESNTTAGIAERLKDGGSGSRTRNNNSNSEEEANPASMRYALHSASSRNNEQAPLQPPFKEQAAFLHGPPLTVHSPLQSTAAAARRRHSQLALVPLPGEAAGATVVQPPADALANTKTTTSTRSSIVSEMFSYAADARPQRYSASGEAGQRQSSAQGTRKVPAASNGLLVAQRGTPNTIADAAGRRKSEATVAEVASPNLLSFSPLVPRLALTPEEHRRSSPEGNSRYESIAATAAPTVISPNTTGAAAAAAAAAVATPLASGGGGSGEMPHFSAVESPHGRGSLSYTGGAHRSSVVSFEAPLILDGGSMSRDEPQRQCAMESSGLRGILESSPTAATTSESVSGLNAEKSPSGSLPLRADGHGSGPADAAGRPSRCSPRSPSKRGAVSSHVFTSVFAVRPRSGSAKGNRAVLAGPHAATPFLLPNCAMMSSVNLESPGESMVAVHDTAPHTTFYPTTVSNVVSVSGPLGMSNATSGAMGDSFLTNATEESRTLMMLSAFPIRQTPVAAPSLLNPGEGGDPMFHHHYTNGGIGGVGGGGGGALAAPSGNGFTAEHTAMGMASKQVVSPSALRAGRGRVNGEAAISAMPPRPPSAGRIPSASTASTPMITTLSSSTSGTPSSQKLLSHTATTSTTTTTSSSSHLGAAPRWHAFSNPSSPPRTAALMMRVGTTTGVESPSARAAPSLLPRPPSKTRATVSPTASSSAASSVARHTAGN